MKDFTELATAFLELAPFYAPSSPLPRVWRRKVAMWIEDNRATSAPELELGRYILVGFDRLLWKESAAAPSTEESIKLAEELAAGTFAGSKSASAIVHIAGCMVENTVDGNLSNRAYPLMIRELSAVAIGELTFEYLHADGHELVTNRNARFVTLEKCVELAGAVIGWFLEEPATFDAAAHPLTVARIARQRAEELEETSVGCEFCAAGRALDVDESGRPICGSCSTAVGMDSNGRHRLSNFSSGIMRAGEFDFGPGAKLDLEGFEVFARFSSPRWKLERVFVWHGVFQFESEARAALERLRSAFVRGSFTQQTLERSSSYWSALVDPAGNLSPIPVVKL